MNTSQLECFVQVAESLSFHRAAEELHLSQPTVSKQVAALEAEVGGALFVRTTREVMLTALGTAFLGDAREILRLSYAAGERARRLAASESLAIGYSDSNELMRLVPVLDRLRQEADDLRIMLVQGPRDANIGRLEREQLDAVMGFETATQITDSIGFERLRLDGLSCIVRLDSPLALHEEVGPEDVEGLPQVLCVSPGLRRRGAVAQESIPDTPDTATTRCTTSTEAYSLVDAGFGYALVPTIYTMPDPYHKALRWRTATPAWYGFYRRDGAQTHMMKRFAEVMRELFALPGYDHISPEVWQP